MGSIGHVFVDAEPHLACGFASQVAAFAPCRKYTYRNYKTKVGYFGYIPKEKNSKHFLNTDKLVIENRYKNAKLLRLITAFRDYGYKNADLDPLKLREKSCPELNPALYGFDESYSDEKYNLEGLLNLNGRSEARFDEILKHLEETYCHALSAEISHIKNEDESNWLASKVEESRSWDIGTDKKVKTAVEMLKSQAFDHFVGKKFMTLKRYSGEGAESMIAFLTELFSLSAHYDVKDLTLCLAHRGRLNLLTGLLNYPHGQMFAKMKGNPEFASDLKYSGDVLSHLYASTDLQFHGKDLHVSLLPNPSHLESINPSAVGKTRAKQLSFKEGHYNQDGSSSSSNMGDQALCLQIHGDAAVAAQGIVMETACMANLPHYDIGGSIHLVVNNQLGFTTPADRASSAMHCSDVMKMIGAPVIHVNGDHPEEVLKACRIAMEYRMKFRKDVMVNMLCFRRWGHNEIDDPTFTNPSMYRIINDRISTPDLYAKKLIDAGCTTQGYLDEEIALYNDLMSAALASCDKQHPKHVHFKENWKSFKQAQDEVVTLWDSGCALETLRFVGEKSVSIADGFNIHPHLKKMHCEARLNKLKEGKHIDWATAEALAFGSLLHEGINVRLSGQDVGRGTFSHRHCMLVDQKEDEVIVPLNHMQEDQKAFLEVANSPLSEEAVIGFEYGMSIDNPKNLIVWEAQFGDFFNGAQIIFDTFITSGELKWILQSGLVVMLPHGYDGAGPEHSSCRIERFLQLSDSKEDSVDGDNVNFSIVNPTTPAQYFHLLRRQIVRNYRKPLVIASPKLILRLPAATSSLDEMSPGTHFKPVIGDSNVDAQGVKKVIFCSGKHFYALDKNRASKSIKDTAIIRIEELAPFPAEFLKEELRKYPNAKEFLWCQEEHRNMGPWFFVNPRFQNVLNVKLTYCGRPVHGTPAVGISSRHANEAEVILADAFK
eukprot:gene20276-22262_t